MGIRPNRTGSVVIGTTLIKYRVISQLPRTRAPTRADNQRKFCRLASVSKSITSTALSFVVHSRSGAAFRGHLRGLHSLTRSVGRGCKPRAIALSVRRSCRGVVSIVRSGVRVISLTGRTVTSRNLAPLSHPVHNNASNTELSFVKLPYPGLNANNCNFRNPCRRVSIRNVRATIHVLGGVTARPVHGWVCGGPSTIFFLQATFILWLVGFFGSPTCLRGLRMRTSKAYREIRSILEPL